MATGVRAPIQGAGPPALDNRQSAGISSARRSSSSSLSSPREHRRSGRRKRDRHVSKRRSYRSRSSRHSRRSRASRWRSPSSSGSSSGRSHRQESSRRRSIHRMERQGPMTPVAREASCPDTGAPIVPKKESGKYRLIHHLSYPKGMSVNDGIPSDETAVTYISFDKAVDLVRNAGPGALMAKSDIESAFRLLPKTIGPVSVITFLGIEIDSVAMEFRLPKEKIDKLLDLISGCISIEFTGTALSGTLGGGGLPTFDLGCPGDLMPLIRSSIAPST
ncbi:unnamed protein product [Ranitomeya imitator]|uniref:Uncharacterized protein n=1 Tax=Ranitomeya imitator TaxID=111125 RepID=A0ABN9MGI7_9NEOB|nr:unnamed protein product [Ranitomeya imitator]